MTVQCTILSSSTIVNKKLFISIYFSYRGCSSKKSTSAARMNVSVNKERL